MYWDTMNNQTMKMSFVGDILLHSKYDTIALQKGTSFVFEKISPVLKDSDLCFGNLECVLSKTGEPNPEKGCLRGDERYIEALRTAGFDVLSLANNHVLDFGFEAFEHMTSKLQSVGIHVVGAGIDLEQSRELVRIDVCGLRIGFLAYSARDNGGMNYASRSEPGVAPLDEEQVLEDIAKHKAAVDHLIVSLHWGIEYSPYPTPHQVLLARNIIDAGVRIIVGHHPRIVQGYEEYNDGVILYSLGNICHSDLNLVGPRRNYTSKLRLCEKELAIFQVELCQDKVKKIDIVPFWLNDSGQPEPCDRAKASEILHKVTERSKKLNSPQFEEYWESLIITKRVWDPVKAWWRSGNLWEKLKNLKPSQITTLWILFSDFLAARFSRKPSKWLLYSTRSDNKARPFCGIDERE